MKEFLCLDVSREHNVQGDIQIGIMEDKLGWQTFLFTISATIS